MELKAKLEQAERDRIVTIGPLDAEIAHLKAKIAEAEKPKLRHGDIWMKDRQVRLHLKEYNDDGRDCMTTDADLFTNLGSYHQGEPVLANLKDIFDDLKALQEPLDNFNIKGAVTRWCNDGDLAIGPRYVNPSDVDEFIRKLQQMRATQKRKA